MRTTSSYAPLARSMRPTRGSYDSATHSQRPSGVTASPFVKCGASRESTSPPARMQPSFAPQRLPESET